MDQNALNLSAVVAQAAPEELPGLIGRLAEAQAKALARIVQPRAPQPTEDRLLTMGEAAKMLGVSEHRAREMGRRRELPVVQLGERQVRISAARLAEWVRRRENGRG